MLFTDLFTVLLSGDETQGQFGVITSESPAGDIIPTHSHNPDPRDVLRSRGQSAAVLVNAQGDKTSKILLPGDFGYVPAGTPHAYKIEESARLLG